MVRRVDQIAREPKLARRGDAMQFLPTPMSTRPDSSVVPEGLEEVSYTFRLPVTAIDDVGALLKDVASLKAAGSSKDSARAVGEGGKHYHAHFSVRLVESKWVRFEFELITSKVSSSRYDPISLLISKVAPHIKSKGKPPETSGLLGVTYELRSGEWSPTVDLPFNVPGGGIAAIPGAPAIVGVDVEFQRSEAELPLRRAFVSTYPDAQMLVVRLLLSFSSAFEDTLVTRMLDEPHKFLSWFARPKGKAKA